MDMTNHTDVTSTVNDLVEICRDGQQGFQAAAENLTDPALRAEFMQYSSQRRQFADELKSALEAVGEKPADHSTLSGSLHRGWINLKQAVVRNDNKAVLSECERGEDAAVDAYRKALQAGLPAPFNELVQTEYADVQRVHDRVRSLRDQWKDAN